MASHFNRLTVKLGGKHPAPSRVAIPDMRDHLTKPLPPAPLAVDWCTGVTGWRMFLNDRLSCCTVAAAANALAQWTHFSDGQSWVVTNEVIEDRYRLVSGYDGTQVTDDGAYASDVLIHWARDGWNVGRQDIDVAVFGSVAPHDHQLVGNVIKLFGGLYVSLGLPLSAQSQSVWSVQPDLAAEMKGVGTWGYHEVYVAAYDEEHLTCITWGEPLKMTWDFFLAYCTGAYAIFSRNDWLNVHDQAPNHFDLAALSAALPPLPKGLHIIGH